MCLFIRLFDINIATAERLNGSYWISGVRYIYTMSERTASVYYTVSKKTTMTLYTITSLRINRFW